MIKILILSLSVLSLGNLLLSLEGNDAFWFCVFAMCVGVLFVDREKGGI